MKKHFRKLAHCTEDESSDLRRTRINMSILSFMLECSIKYDNIKQIEVCRAELEIYKNEYEMHLENIFTRTGQYPGSGKVEIHRSGDVIEYFRN